jgi:CBS domain-containing protein
MTNKLFSLSPTNDFEDALKLMTENQIRHCIVTDSEGRLRGVLSARDVLRRLSRSEECQTKTVADIMTHNTSSVTAETKLVHAVAQMIAKDIHCLPVTKPGAIVVGILTSTNLLESFETTLKLRAESFHPTG